MHDQGSPIVKFNFITEFLKSNRIFGVTSIYPVIISKALKGIKAAGSFIIIVAILTDMIWLI